MAYYFAVLLPDDDLFKSVVFIHNLHNRLCFFFLFLHICYSFVLNKMLYIVCDQLNVKYLTSKSINFFSATSWAVFRGHRLICIAYIFIFIIYINIFVFRGEITDQYCTTEWYIPKSWRPWVIRFHDFPRKSTEFDQHFQ